MIRKIILAVSLVAIFGFIFWRIRQATPIYQALSKQETVTIDGQVFNVEVASTLAEQAQGLSNKTSLAPTSGMLFPFNPPSKPDFWMKDMNFPLDFVWIDNGKIVDITANVPAPEKNTPTDNLPLYSPSTNVDNVLEINAGAAKNLRVGDTVKISSASGINGKF